MFKLTRRKLQAFMAVAFLTIATFGLGVAPAQATGIYFSVNHDSSQLLRGEPFKVTPSNSTCPSGSTVLQSVMVDSANQTFTRDLLSTPPTGSWTYAIAYVDPSAAIGAIDFYLQCRNAVGVNMTYDTTQVFVNLQPTWATVLHKGIEPGYATFSSPMQCFAGGTVNLRTFGTPVTPGGDPTQLIDSVQFAPDANGYWSYALLMDSSKYKGGGDYYAIWSCWNADTTAYNWTDTAFHFTPLGDEYVALGDSYSSGEGSFKYDLTGNGSNCHNSTDSYPYVIALEENIPLPSFVACSGSVTDDLFNSTVSSVLDYPQLNSLTSETQLVTLTIGGNDVGFAEIMEDCVNVSGTEGWNCLGTGSQPSLSGRLSALDGLASATSPEGRNVRSISSILEAINTASPDAHIYIAGYPHLFGTETSNYESDNDAPGGYKCVIEMMSGASVSLWDAQALNNKVDELNGIIENAVINAPIGYNAHYVSPSTFDGHGNCDSATSYLNGVVLPFGSLIPQSESFHPNKAGMRFGYGAAFLAAM